MNVNVFAQILTLIDRRELAIAAGLMARAGLDRDTAPQALYVQGLLAYARGDLRAAKVKFSRAAKAAPRFALPLIALGNATQALGEHDAALKAYKAALALEPDNPAILGNIGAVESASGQWDDAEATFTRLLEIAPDDAAALTNLARHLRIAGDFDRAASYARRLGDSVLGLRARAAISYSLGETAETLALIEQARALAPTATELDEPYAFALLRSGRLREGFAALHTAFRSEGLAVALPQWDDANQPPRHVVVVAKQGLSDAIQLSRFLPALVERGIQVRLLAPRRLSALLKDLPAHLMADETDIGEATATCSLMSIPYLLGVDHMDQLRPVAPLAIDAAKRPEWRKRLPAHGLRVGIVWQASLEGKEGTGRSFPLQSLASAAAIPGVTLVALQQGDGRDQLKSIDWTPPVVAPVGIDAGPDAFVDTATILQELDLAITCDTSVSHVAGSLGVPVWVLLQRGPDWRWFDDIDDSPWYPSARLFRQEIAGDWSRVHARVAAALAEAVAAKAAAAR